MRWLFCMLVIVVFGAKANAQIQLQNPSMEGTPCIGFCYPDNWSFCGPLCIVLDSTITPFADKKPADPVDGIAYTVMENQPPLELGTLAQQLPCPFLAHHNYYFELSDATCWSDSGSSEAFGYLQIYAGYDSCDRHQLLWQSELLDTVWKKESITFIPNQNYDWLILWPQYDSIPFVDIAVDALSPIYLINANQVNALGNDTAIYAGNCVSLEASSTNTTYDSLYWINATANTTFSPNQWNTLVCPDSSTMYLIAMRDSVPDCAGYKWSYDTIKVQVIDTTTAIGKAQLNNFVLSVYPNPAKETVMIKCTATDKQDLILQAVNPLGQVMYQQSFSDSQPLNIAHWPAGMYCFTLSQNGQPLATARFLKE